MIIISIVSKNKCKELVSRNQTPWNKKMADKPVHSHVKGIK